MIRRLLTAAGALLLLAGPAAAQLVAPQIPYYGSGFDPTQQLANFNNLIYQLNLNYNTLYTQLLPSSACAPGYVIGNATGFSRLPTCSSMTSILDEGIGLVRGSIMERGAAAWVALPPGTGGLALVSAGLGADPAYAVLGAGGGGTGATSLGSEFTAAGGIFHLTGTLPSGLTAPSFTVTTGFTATGLVTNADLVNPATTVNSQTCTLGSTCTVTATASNILTFGTHLASGGTSYNGSAPITITSDATNANTASTIVARDASGNFSAGTITASLTGGATLDLPLAGGTLTGTLTAKDGGTWGASGLTASAITNTPISGSTGSFTTLAINVTGTLGSTNQTVNYHFTDSGTVGVPAPLQPIYWRFDDTLNDGADFVDAVTLAHYFGGSSVQGGRQTFASYGYLTAATSASNTNRNYVAIQGVETAQTGDGGTSGSPLGAIFAGGWSAVAQSGAGYLNNLTAGEFNVSELSSQQTYYKSIIQLASNVGDAYRGSHYDAILSISAQTNTLANGGWLNGILFSKANGAAPVGTDGSLISAMDSLSVLNGIDFSNVTFSGSAFASSGFSVDGSGNTTVGILFGSNNSSGGYPPSAATTWAITDNFQSGPGEVDFWNRQNNGLGFAFYQKTGTSAATLMANWTPTNLAMNIPVGMPGYTVASLPAGVTGQIAYVTDQLTSCPALNGTFTGGGAVKCLAFYNGTSWIYP